MKIVVNKLNVCAILSILFGINHQQIVKSYGIFGQPELTKIFVVKKNAYFALKVMRNHENICLCKQFPISFLKKKKNEFENTYLKRFVKVK